METETIKIAEFIEKHGIRMTARRVKANPNMSDMGKDARHWNCTFQANGDAEKMVVPFSQGSAHTQEPTAADVLDCLASDAATIENAKGFEDWASDLGYDSDSRKAEKTYNVCKAQSEALQAYLGDEAYQELLWNTERN